MHGCDPKLSRRCKDQSGAGIQSREGLPRVREGRAGFWDSRVGEACRRILRKEGNSREMRCVLCRGRKRPLPCPPRA